MELDPEKKETKLFSAVIDLLDDLSASVEELEEGFDDITDSLQEIDEDLGDIESEVYGLDEDDEDGCSCGCGHHCHHHDDEDWDDGEDYGFEVTCPSCGTTIELDDEAVEAGSIVCPECGETLEFDYDDVLDMTDVSAEDVEDGKDEDPKE